MDYNELLRKRELYQSGKSALPAGTIQAVEEAFEIQFAHDSTAIEGNTLTLEETKQAIDFCRNMKKQEQADDQSGPQQTL